MTYKVWGFQLELQNLLFQNDDGDDGVDDDDDGWGLGSGNWGLKVLKPKAKFLMLLCCEHDLQGLGFPVGAPKPPFQNDVVVGDDDGDVLGIGDWGLQGSKPKAKFLMLLCCEHDLHGLGFPVGAPKHPFSK